MSVLGLGDEPKTNTKDEKTKNTNKKSNDSASQNDEAKDILAKMEAKKDAGDCPFC